MTSRRHRHVSSSGPIEEGVNLALSARDFFMLYETSVRWDCSIADNAGWAAVGKLKIKTGIGLVRCGEAVVAGQVDISAVDLLPLFRPSGTGPVAWQAGTLSHNHRVRRIKKAFGRTIC